MEIVEINKGSDIEFPITWGSDGDLDGAIVSFYDVHPSLAGCLTVAVLNSAERKLICGIQWSETIVNDAYFRILVTISGRRATSKRFKLAVI